MKKITVVITISLLSIFGLLACDDVEDETDSSEAVAEAPEAEDSDEPGAPSAASGETVDLDVDGMTCVSCAASIEEALGETDGVVTGRIDFGNRQAHVEYDPDKLDVDALIAVIDEAGFTATVPGEEGETEDADSEQQ